MLIIVASLMPSVVIGSDNDVIFGAKRAILNQLKDPGSVDFKDVFYSYTEKGGGVACGRFNAKNSFGSYAGYKRFISNGGTTFIDGQSDSKPPFSDLWVMLCLN